MRNYFKVLALTWVGYINTPYNFWTEMYQWGETEDEINSGVAQQNAFLASIYNPAQIDFSYPQGILNVYILNDKANMMRLLRFNQISYVLFNLGIGYYNTGDPSQWVSAENSPNGKVWDVLVNPSQSPRYTGWKDLSGVLRRPTPSDKGAKGNFSGAAGLLAAAQGLLAYSDALRKAGRIRDANIVKYAYDQIFTGTWSITKAFDYLLQNNL